MELIVLLVVVGAGVSAACLDFLYRRWILPSLPKPHVPVDETEAIVRGIVAGAEAGKEVRWGSMVVVPKDRGPTLRTWRIEVDGYHPLRVIGAGELESVVRRHIRAMRRNGVQGDATDIHSTAVRTEDRHHHCHH